MSSSSRRRQQTKAYRAEATFPTETRDKSAPNYDLQSSKSGRFHSDLWWSLALNNWIFDFGRPIAAMFVPLHLTPLDKPSIGDYFHMAYNVVTPFCLLKLIERSSGRVSSTVTYLAIITLVMGASIHLVGDSVNHRLIHLGYKNHLSVQENPLMKELRPRELIKSFELLYRYDEEIGHLMWYIPFFLCLFLFYMGSFVPHKPRKVNFSWYSLVLVSGVYYWYLATEGQIFPLFLLTYICLLVTRLVKSRNGLWSDANGQFLLWTFTLTVILTGLWSLWLWDDPVLRVKYPGVLYVPEPWAYYTLHLQNT